MRAAASRSAIVRDPLLFLHEPAAGCAECDQARLSVSRAIIRDVGDEPGPG
jgi:hypothetical protein